MTTFAGNSVKRFRDSVRRCNALNESNTFAGNVANRFVSSVSSVTFVKPVNHAASTEVRKF